MKRIKKMCSRWIAMLLVVVMVLGMVPTTVFAADLDDQDIIDLVEEVEVQEITEEEPEVEEVITESEELLAAEEVIGTPITVTDNVIDIADDKFASRSSWHATATAITISGAVVESASQDGRNVYVVLDGATEASAEVTANFNFATNKLTATSSVTSVTLENGAGTLTTVLNGKYYSIDCGSGTYNLHFSLGTPPTEVPTRVVESDSTEVYAGIRLEIKLSQYFDGASEYYLVEEGTLTPLESNKYSFLQTAKGTYYLTFAAANIVGTCSDYVTVTVNVKEIEDGIWIGNETSNGAFNFVTFADSEGQRIEGLECVLDGTTITVSLPKGYEVNGKVKATFNLTQNDSGLPFLSTSNAATGSGSADSRKVTELTTTLSSGAATARVYFYNAVPKATSNSYTTYTINYAVKNDLPVLAEGQEASAAASMTAGDNYTLDLSKLFTDADGDALTYYVRINGETAVSADAAYSYTTNTAGEYTLVFTAHDGKGSSTDTYTVTLTVENSKETESMRILVPEGINPVFYAANGYENGVDVLGDALNATAGSAAEGITTYTVTYPSNAEKISFRTEEWGGMAIDTEKDAEVTLSQIQVKTVDFADAPLDATVVVSYGDYKAVSGTEGFLLVSGKEYTVTATPTDTTTYVVGTKTVTAESTKEVQTVTIAMGFKNPKTIKVPTGATAQLFSYNKYYDFTEQTAKAAVDNEDGTTTYYFTPNGNSPLSYRASMDGKVTEAGYWNNNVTITFDDGANSSKNNAAVNDCSVLLNVNGQNHLALENGESYKLKAYRTWEIIKYSYQNEIITPDFHFDIISGDDVVSLEPVDSKSNGGSGENSDWMMLKALKEGTAVIEVTYDAIDVTGGSWPGLYGASDKDRTGLIVVTVGGEDSSVDFGIDCLASQGSLTYNAANARDWDAEFDTLYFVGESGELKLSPTAASEVKEVAISSDKGTTWNVLTGDNGNYTANIAAGNNVIRVTTETGVAYQVVRGAKVTTTVTEVADASDADGYLEAGETVRIKFDGLYTPIPKIAGNYNPGYKANYDGDSSVHMVYSCNGETITGSGVQYTFGAEGNTLDITIPENYEENEIALTDGYIAVGVLGLKTFTTGGDSHRNIPDAGCTTRESETTFHTRSILPELTFTVGEPTAPNTTPTVVENAVTEANITVGDTYKINPDTLFTDADQDVLTYTVSVDEGEAAAVTSSYQWKPEKAGTYKLVFTASDGKEEVSHTITLIVAEAEVPDDKEEPDDDVTLEGLKVYFSVSNDDAYFKCDETDEVMALKELHVPYFDLANYGLEQYYYTPDDYAEGDIVSGTAETAKGKVTMLHMLLYATEVYYCGVPADQAGQGYLWDEGILGTDVLTVSGSPGSMYIGQFWNMTENLNYYLNYVYPLASDGWGATLDQILLEEGDVVTVGHFSSWDFHSDTESGFHYIKHGDTDVATTTVQGEKVELSVFRSGKGGDYQTAHFPANSGIGVYYVSSNDLNDGNITNWNNIGSVDDEGMVTFDTSDLTPGKYLVAMAGQLGLDYPDTICSTPGGIWVTVEEAPEEEIILGTPVLTKVQKWGYNALKISWDEAENADGYRLYYCSENGEWEYVDQIDGSGTTSYVHVGLTTGKTYTYRVRAYRMDGRDQVFGEYSNEVSGKPIPRKAVITKAQKWGYQAIKISWNKVNGATGYELYYREAGENTWNLAVDIKKGSTLSYVHNGVISGKTYEYRLIAYRTIDGEKVFGTYSDVVAGKTQPRQVQITSVKKASASGMKIKWEKVAGATGYRIYYREAGTNTWKYVTQIGKGSTLSYTHKGLEKGKTYEYRMRAYRTVDGTKVFGVYSTVKTGTIK